MRKSGEARFLLPVGDPADPDGLYRAMRRYIEHLKFKGATPQSLYNTERYLRDFIAWCDDRDLARPHQITKPILESYQRYLFYRRKADGQALSFTSQRAKLTPVRMLFRWLARHNVIGANPAADLELPRVPRRLPKAVLTADEVERVLALPNTTDPIGLRDRALMEVLYSTGMRRMELANLDVADVDTERATVLIRQGKGRKDRMVPIGDRALAWVKRYLDQSRPRLVAALDDGVLFLTREGERFNPEWLSSSVARYVDRADLGKRGACHLFRHTMATLMLEGGADLRFIQAMLGHTDVSTTQIYTQVAIRQLQQVHASTHPAALQARRDDGAGETGQTASDAAEAAHAARQALLTAIATENEDGISQEPPP
jgi:integrase/recombinase XerD